jgi:AraC-like DNA-binding protein
VEVIYNCQGETTHIVNGKTIILKAGDLLFLNQTATHEICKAEFDDIAVNFIVLPEFFSTPLSLVGEEETPLHKFLIGCLCGENANSGYLHFEVADVLPIQNLLENLVWILIEDTPAKRKMSQMTMALLLMQLLAHTEKLLGSSVEESVIWQVLRYVEKDYAKGSFASLCKMLHYEPSWLSRQIKQKTGKTYTQLVQEKRMAQAAYLLNNTTRKVNDIALEVGYENISYFHRIFTKTFEKSPKHYRDNT